MSTIPILPVYGNGWFGPDSDGHILPPEPFEVRDMLKMGNSTFSEVVAGQPELIGLIMSRSESFLGQSENQYYTVDLYPRGSLSAEALRPNVFPLYSGYAQIRGCL
jgi:hypothetical protein